VTPASTSDADGAGIEELVERTIGGEGDAWQELWLAVEPTLYRIAAHFRVTSRLSRSDDDRRNIVVRVMGQLHADGFRRLRLYCASRARRGDGTFRAWLTTLAARSAISYLRAHPEYLGRPGPDEVRRGRWAQILPLCGEHDDPPSDAALRAGGRADEPGAAADPVRTMEGRALMARARETLREDQLAALMLWLTGREHGEIAAELGLDGALAAERLVRSALKRMRDRIGRGDDAAPSSTPPSAGPASSSRSGSASGPRGSRARTRSPGARLAAGGARRR
jgi:DNA-directed RNA polymerase specialized sigma24 family protein